MVWQMPIKMPDAGAVCECFWAEMFGIMISVHVCTFGFMICVFVEDRMLQI